MRFKKGIAKAIFGPGKRDKTNIPKKIKSGAEKAGNFLGGLFNNPRETPPDNSNTPNIPKKIKSGAEKAGNFLGGLTGREQKGRVDNTNTIPQRTSGTQTRNRNDIINETKVAISSKNSTFGKDPAVDNMLSSQYLNEKDKINESYIDKVGMETGLYADIQNTDDKILDTMRILSLPDRDIFNRQDVSPAEKIAMSRQRRNIASNRIGQLRKLQSAKQNEIRELAQYETQKAKAQEEANKQNLLYMKQINENRKMDLDERKFGLDVYKAEAGFEDKRTGRNLDERKFGLDVYKAEAGIEGKNLDRNLAERKFGLDKGKFLQDISESKFDRRLDAEKFKLDNREFGLSRDKFTSSESDTDNLIVGNFQGLAVGGKYGNWKVTQTYGTNSILGIDNVKLVNGKVGTPGVDLAGNIGDPISAFSGGTIVKVTSGQSNIPRSEWGKTGGSYGNQVIVKDRQGQLHYYNHLDNVANLEEGQDIQRGQSLGTMGNSGTSTGVHLDYRVKSNRGWEDPTSFMSKKSDKKADNKIEITNLDEYLDVRNNTAGGNIITKIKPGNVNQIITDDIGKFQLSTDEFNKLIEMPGANIDPKIAMTYQLEQFNSEFSSIQTNEEIKDFIEVNMLDEKNKIKSIEDRESLLTALIYSGKIGGEYFESGMLSDGEGYDILQKYFDDPDEIISQIKLSLSEEGIKVKDVSIQDSEPGIWERNNYNPIEVSSELGINEAKRNLKGARSIKSFFTD